MARRSLLITAARALDSFRTVWPIPTPRPMPRPIILLPALGLALGLVLVQARHARAWQDDIAGPPGSGQFGAQVAVLPNGNIVVTDPYYDDGTTPDVGAVYLYDGASGALISRLTGSTAGDRVGESGVTVLSNGNYVVSSPHWDNGLVTDTGAVTWASGVTGITGAVSAANSLMGSTTGDLMDFSPVMALSNGNYVVRSPYWDNGAITDAGAVTWGNGATGITGAISVTNSLVGSTADDHVGYYRVTELSNGNYVVNSPRWSYGPLLVAGAVTWASGTTGITGAVSVTNSLVGGHNYDMVGDYEVTALTNGNYVVNSAYWSNGVADWYAGTSIGDGAVTWGNGTTGITGVVSVTNSLVGSHDGDYVGFGGVSALSNGNYVVRSAEWDNGEVEYAGAVTWGNGATGITGAVSAANSLVGTHAGDEVGHYSLVVLSNGNYVMNSRDWDNGPIVDAGAVTWANGATGITGAVSVTNSLVGSSAGDHVGNYDVTALSHGNYVVRSPYWDKGLFTDTGAVTWGNGATGITGVVSITNSLVGSTSGDQAGYPRVTALPNGNYVVLSAYWDKGPFTDTGAATWANGATGLTGAVSITNSLVGSTPGDQVGNFIVTALTNGNYVVNSYYWDNGAAVNAGAVTWGNGATGITGAVSVTNSLVGGAAGNMVGSDWVITLSNGNYVVTSPTWDNAAGALVITDAGATTWGNGATGITGVVSTTNSLAGNHAGDRVGAYAFYGIKELSNGHYAMQAFFWNNSAGAVTWGNGATGAHGTISARNSVMGIASGGGYSMTWVYDNLHDQLVVGRPADNIVTRFRAMPELALSKTVVPTAAVPYDGIVTYTLVLRNAGLLDDPHVILTDTLPAGVYFGQWISRPAGLIRNGAAMTWTGTLTNDTAITLTFTATHTVTRTGAVTNTARFSGTAQAGSASAAFTPLVLSSFTLAVTPTSLLANGVATAALTIRAADQFGGGAAFAGRPVVLAWNLGDTATPLTVTLGPSGTAQIIYTAGTLAGLDTLTASLPDPGGTRVATATLRLINAPLQGVLAYRMGDGLITYTLSVTNADPAEPQTNVVLSGSIPAGTVLVAASTPFTFTTGGDYGRGYVTATVSSLAAGASTQLRWSVRPLSFIGDIATQGHAQSDSAVLRLRMTSRVYRVLLMIVLRNASQ
jgi:uncharacterized repeat protein (TIGR01451 family)